jgi:hypothetical protein
MRVRPEEHLQILIVRRLEDILTAQVVWTAIEHGVTYSGTPLQRQLQWRRLKNKGVRESILDLQFTWPHPSGLLHAVCQLALELKVGRNTATDGQLGYIDRASAIGVHTGVAWSAAEAETIMRAAGLPMNGSLHGIDQQLLAYIPKVGSAKKPRRTGGPKTTSRGLAAIRRARSAGLLI